MYVEHAYTRYVCDIDEQSIKTIISDFFKSILGTVDHDTKREVRPEKNRNNCVCKPFSQKNRPTVLSALLVKGVKSKQLAPHRSCLGCAWCVRSLSMFVRFLTVGCKPNMLRSSAAKIIQIIISVIVNAASRLKRTNPSKKNSMMLSPGRVYCEYKRSSMFCKPNICT